MITIVVIVMEKIISSLFYDQFILHLKHIDKWHIRGKTEKQALYFIRLKSALINLLGKYESNLDNAIRLSKKYTKVLNNKDTYLIFFYVNIEEQIPQTFYNQYFEIISEQTEYFKFLVDLPRLKDIGKNEIFVLEPSKSNLLHELVFNESFKRSKWKFWE